MLHEVCIFLVLFGGLCEGYSYQYVKVEDNKTKKMVAKVVYHLQPFFKVKIIKI